MKDLRFKIIADFVKGGFDKAAASVHGLKGAFSALRGGGVASFAAIAKSATSVVGVIIGVAAAAHRVYTSMRDSYLSNLEQMEDGIRSFEQRSETMNRKLQFASSPNAVARVVEDAKQELEDLKAQQKQLLRREGFETFAEGFQEKMQAKADKALFGGPGITRDEMEIAILQKKITLREKFLALARQKDVSKFGQAEIAEAISSLNDQREKGSAEIAGVAVDQAVEAGVEAVKEAQEKLSTAIQAYAANNGEEEAEAVIKALDRVKAAEAERQSAWLAQAAERKSKIEELAQAELKAFNEMADEGESIGEKRKKEKELVEDVKKTRRDIAYENASPADQRKADLKRLAAIKAAVNNRDGLGQFALPSEKRAELIKEGLLLQEKIRKSTPEKQKPAPFGSVRTRMMRRGAPVETDEDGEDENGVKRMRRGEERTEGFARGGMRGGLRWRAGAMAAEAAGTPGPVEDPQLRETKRTNTLLERIEKKTGAAP